VTWVLHEMRQKREEQKLNLGQLTHMINYHEQNLLQMRKSHDNAVQSRNDRNGDMETQALEEETRCLQMITNEERRQTALSRKL
ncbi:unnamed protein product, partial [Coregonus sp. 'balchen']